MNISEKILHMPKMEMHLHLDGAVRVQTARELLAERGVFFELNELSEKMVISGNLKNQAELLKYFEIPSQVLQSSEALERVAYELILDRSAENIVYAEIRFAPLIHTAKGLSISEVVSAIIKGAEAGKKITGCEYSLIPVALKTHAAQNSLDMLRGIEPVMSERLCAVDYAGAEEHALDPSNFMDFFNLAKEMGLQTTFHCGETFKALDVLENAVKQIKPSRIAHGAVIAGDEKMMSLIKEFDIQLDICPTSNIQAGLFKDYKNFPARKLVDCGVKLSISTDDPILSNISLCQEYLNLIDFCGFTCAELLSLNKLSIDKAFCGFNIKTALKERFSM